MKDQILSELRLLIDQIDNYHVRFSPNDIRSSFLDGYFEILKNYYFSYFHLDDNEILDKYYEIYQRNDFTRADLTVHIQNQINGLNSTLIVYCWSNFELFITLFCNAVLSKKKIDELLELDYTRLTKILKDYPLSTETDSKLQKFTKNHLAHTPIVNKYGKLLKMINPYPSNRNKQYDRDFLEFFGRLRNCMHSNYIYYGNLEKEFTFNDETFSFNHGKPISQKPFRENSTFELTKNLKNIVQLIIENIDYEFEIYDPSVELLK